MLLNYLRIALFAPGIILHEFSHHILCLITGVRVQKVVYFRVGSPAGFVIHDEPMLYRQLFAIVAGPFFLNSTASIVLINISLRQWAKADDLLGLLLAATLTWLGLSFGLQAIPSKADARNLFDSSTWHIKHLNPFAVVGYPVAVAIYIVQLARPLAADWYYAVLLAFLATRGFAGHN